MTVLKHRHAPNHYSCFGGTMAEPNSSSLQKPLVYDLLSRLNASFARDDRKSCGQTRISICSGPFGKSR